MDIYYFWSINPNPIILFSKNLKVRVNRDSDQD